jgi:hypothetical protein
MIEPVPIAANAERKSRQEFADPLAEIEREAKDRAELDYYRKHLPVTVRKIDAQQRFGNAQMGSGTGGKEFSHSFDDT